MGCVSLFLRYQILAVVAVIAVVCFKAQENTPPPFLITIGGVSPGMTRAQVDTLMGAESARGESYTFYILEDSSLRVRFDENERVERVSADFLEVDGVPIKRVRFDDHSQGERLKAVLGEPYERAPRQRGDLSHEVYYRDLDLAVQNGCTGWYFRLGATGY